MVRALALCVCVFVYVSLLVTCDSDNPMQDTLSSHLLLPEAPVDDAATQIVHPFPFDDVIEDELPACRRSQLT